MKKRVYLIITGDVTGVGYRYWARKNAQALGLSGYVRNVETGKVEAVFEGEEETVKEMVERCRKGPEVSWVTKLDEKWGETTGEFKGFEVRF